MRANRSLVNDQDFLIDPQSGFRRSYRQLARDVGLYSGDAWFDWLVRREEQTQGGGVDGGKHIDKPLGSEQPEMRASEPPQEGGSLGGYRVFARMVASISCDRDWEVSSAVDVQLPSTSTEAADRELDSGIVEMQVASADTPLSCAADFLNLICQSRARLGIKTSGTTGRPKLIWHSMQTLTRAVQSSARHADDVWGFAYEPTHFAGIQVFLQALVNRNSIVWLFDLEPGDARAAIVNYGITHISATPTFLKILCAGNEVIPEVRSVTLGGEAFDEAAETAVRRMFPGARVRNVYASTELGSILHADGDVFRVPDYLREAIRIEEGELCVDPKLLADSIEVNGPGFFATGDRVSVVTESPLTFRFVGRRSDWINVGGTKVNPLRVESVLTQISEIDAARVFGQENSVVGSLVGCEIVLVEGAQLDQNALKILLADRLSRYEMPQIVRFVKKLKMTRTGKKQR